MALSVPQLNERLTLSLGLALSDYYGLSSSLIFKLARYEALDSFDWASLRCCQYLAVSLLDYISTLGRSSSS